MCYNKNMRIKHLKKSVSDGMGLMGIWKFTIRDAKTGRIKRIYEYRNLVPIVGRAAIADHLTASSPSPASLKVNKVALGTGVTAPANANTILETEVYRNNIASATKDNHVAYLSGYFSHTETTGTYKEAGLFINGGAGADTGTLISRVAIDITKSGTETLSVDWTLTIS